MRPVYASQIISKSANPDLPLHPKQPGQSNQHQLNASKQTVWPLKNSSLTHSKTDSLKPSTCIFTYKKTKNQNTTNIQTFPLPFLHFPTNQTIECELCLDLVRSILENSY